MIHQSVPPSSTITTDTSFRLLVVEDNDRDARLIERVMRRERPEADLHRAQSFAEARALLKEVQCEVALVNHVMPDGSSVDFLGFVRQHALDLPVVVLTRSGHVDIARAALGAGAADCIHKDLDRQHLKGLPARLQQVRQRHQEARVKHTEYPPREGTLHTTITKIKHEINNPLAIISGNAQLLLELARALSLGDDLMKPIQDIEEASRRIATSLEKLNGLKEIIADKRLNGNGTYVNGRNGTS